MFRLHVNIDHVATLRNARGTLYPDPVLAAELCELAGADGITAHLREDRRHIKDDDVERLRHSLTTLLNLEMAATDEMIAIAERVRPDVVTLVPERREELTTEGGLDVLAARNGVERAAAMCARTGIKLSLFIEADPTQIEASRDLGARQIELHTGEYAHARGSRRAEVLTRLAQGARFARKLGLEVAAGHGLTRDNVPAIAAIPELEELNIGHALISDAILIGMDRAVRDMRRAIDRGLDARRERLGAGA
jgi:pyridoxine 5-phosphate synthase